MPVFLLNVPEWDGRHGATRTIAKPRCEDVREAIRQLDNDRFCEVYLQGFENAETFWLSIGGGAGKYLITGAAEEGHYATVVAPTICDTTKRKLVVGGQLGLYPASWIQDLETA